MDVDAAGFVLDKVDIAREALTEARQVVDKFAQAEDAEIGRLLDEMLEKANQVDLQVRAGNYPRP